MQYADYQNAFIAALAEELQHRPESEIRGFLTKFIEIKNGIRLYYLNEAMVTGQLWDMFRTDEPSFDLLMKCTASFCLRVSTEEANAWETLTALLVSSVGCLTHSDSKLADKDVGAKITTVSTLRSLVKNENWLVFVLFASMNTAILPRLTPGAEK